MYITSLRFIGAVDASSDCERKCRSECEPYTVTVTCDNVVDEFYVDGQRYPVANHGNWENTATIQVPSDSKTLAIRCTDHGVIPGVMVATSNMVFTGNGRWRCTNTYHHSWMVAGYSHKSWPKAVVKGENGGSPWNRIIANMYGAKWIWTSARGGTVYCRVDL